jgi:hypothetical protein
MRAISLLLAALGVRVSGVSVRELDAVSFNNVVSDAETDSIVLFTHTSSPESRKACLAMMDALAARLKDGSSALYTFDVHALGGWPAGLHVHSAHASEASLLIFPAGGREPARYEFSHDPLSVTAEEREAHGRERDAAGGGGSVGSGGGGSGGGGDGDGSGGDEEHDEHDEHVGHLHAARPSVVGALRWLRRVSSFPATVPEVSLAELYEGREDELFQATASAVDVIRARILELKAQVSALTKENERLRSRCAAAAQQTSGGGGGGGGGGRGNSGGDEL